MSFKNNLRSKQAQVVVEYIVTFIILAIGILLIFGSFNPENVRAIFDRAVNNAIAEITR